jgi:hypothetical protein
MTTLMPLIKRYRRWLDSEIADLRNIGGATAFGTRLLLDLALALRPPAAGAGRAGGPATTLEEQRR